MNLLTDAAILIEFSKKPNESDSQIRRTILGTTVNIACALVLVFEHHPDFVEAVETALDAYKKRASKP